jgi:hypothetical protein
MAMAFAFSPRFSGVKRLPGVKLNSGPQLSSTGGEVSYIKTDYLAKDESETGKHLDLSHCLIHSCKVYLAKV